MSKLSPLALGILLGLAFPLSAQVYQSTDEDGNVSFSDQPSSGSKAVDIPETNVGDSVDVPPPAPEPEAPPEPEVVEQKAPEGELVGIEKHDDNYHHRHRHRPRPRPRANGR